MKLDKFIEVIWEGNDFLMIRDRGRNINIILSEVEAKELAKFILTKTEEDNDHN